VEKDQGRNTDHQEQPYRPGRPTSRV